MQSRIIGIQMTIAHRKAHIIHTKKEGNKKINVL